MKEKQIVIKGRIFFISEDGTLKNERGKILKYSIDNVGYQSILIKKKRYLIHRLVAQAFMPEFSEELQVHHIDENKSNNNVSNLQCMTKEEHQHLHKQIYPLTKKCSVCGKEFTPHKTKRKIAKTCSYECWLQTIKDRNEKNKTKVSQYDTAGNLIKIWDSFTSIQNELGYYASNINKCCNGLIKTYKGYVWRYFYED